jgi:hypothetical protein
MKKKVRIYKAPDGKGKYVNKTSKFLAKAQMGGTPDPSMLGYPGAQPTQQQDKSGQIIQFVVNDITNQVAKEETLFKLVNIMGVPVDAATELYVTIAEKLTEDIEREDDKTYEEETGQPRIKENPLTKDAVITENPEQETDYDLFDDTGSDIVMDDSDQGPDILDEALDPLAEQRYGGSTMRRYQSGGEYDVALPSADNYEDLVQPMTGYDLVSRMAWNSGEESMSPYAQKEYANTTLDYSKLQNGGAYKKAKKKYVTSVMGLLKKQMGGTNGSDVDPNQGDPTGANFREGRLKLFTDSIKNDAQMSAMQNQIEQQYDQMMQEGGVPMPEQDVENPMHHLQLYSQTASGIFGEPMNETIKAQNGMIVGDDLPKGFYRRAMKRFGNIPNLREVDVRKSGLFGPKQYTMYFDPLPLQQLSNPMAAQVYGYGSGNTAARKYTRTFDAVKTYTNLAADAVNQESLKEVDKNTPENKSTTVNEQKGKETPVATVSNVQRNQSNSSSSSATPVVVESVDAWGRQPGDRWYGFDESKKVFTEASNYEPSAAATRLYSAANPEGNYYKENGRYYKQVGQDYFEIVDPARIKQLKESKVLNYQKLPGVNTTYSKDAFGNWVYYDEKAGKFKPSSDKNRLEALEAGKARSAAFGTLKDKPGYYYRIANDGSFIKFKGDPAKHTRSKQPITTIKKGDKEYNYVAKNIKVSETLLPTVAPMGDNLDDYLKKLRDAGVLQYGGTIENPFSNPLEPLQKFVGGGYDPSIPDLTEDNIQYMNSKDITDAYMQGGGFIKNFIPANLTRSAQNDVVQRIYNPVTGQTRQGGPGAGNYISAIDVRKRGITGRPKKYTIYYGSEGDPRYENLITLDGAKGKDTKTTQKSQKQQALENAGYGDRTDVSGLKGKSKRAIRQGERQRDRDLKKLYEVDPTSVEFTAIDQNAPFDYTQPKPKLSAQDYLTTSWGDVRGDLNPDLQTNLDEFLKTDPTPEQIDDKVAELLEQRARDMGPDPSFFASPEQEKINQSNLQRNPMFMGFNKGPVNTQQEDVVEGNDMVQEGDVPYPTVGFGDLMSNVGPVAGEEDQLTPEEDAAARAQFAQEYMGDSTPYDPNTALVTPGMIDYNFIQDPEAAYNARLQELNPMTDMGAWSGMSGPADILEPGVNPFELPVGGGEEYYPPFAQPVIQPVKPSVKPNQNKRQTLDEWKASERKRPNYGKTYTYKPNMTGMQKDPDYIRAMQAAGKDGVVTNQESENAIRIFKQKQAQQEKDRIASQAQRAINQIMNSSASAAEKNKAREKVVLQMQQRWDVVDRAANSRKYGGALSRFVNGGNNQPFTGENPVAYTNNPLMQGKSDLDLISLNSGIQGAQGQVNWGQLSPTNTVTQQNNDGTRSYGVDASYKGTQPTEIRIDPMQKEEYQVDKTYSEPLAIDVKNKLSQGEREARLIAGNSLLRGIAGYKNRIDDTKQMEGFYDNLTADNLYASDPSRDRGDYAESGLYRPDEQGQTWYCRSAQMGGYVDDDFEDGEEVYMTDEEIREYMANGGQIEFI